MFKFCSKFKCFFLVALFVYFIYLYAFQCDRIEKYKTINHLKPFPHPLHYKQERMCKRINLIKTSTCKYTDALSQCIQNHILKHPILKKYKIDEKIANVSSRSLISYPMMFRLFLFFNKIEKKVYNFFHKIIDLISSPFRKLQ